MGHGKETPRQKMIGLMYLFLTALMALNVSKDVLNSFVLVSDSLEKTINNYKSKNEKVYEDFKAANAENPTKVGPWLTLAEEVKKETQELFDGLEQHKIELAKYAEGDESPAVANNQLNINKLEAKDNIDKGGEYFIGRNHGAEIKKQIDSYRQTLIKISEGNEKLQQNIASTLDTEVHIQEGEDGGGHSKEAATWESMTFEHIPLVADFVMLSTLQTNIKNMETDVINYLYSQISAGDFKVNAMEATVIPNSNYIMRGNEYRAQVFLAAYDSTKAPVIKVGNYKKTSDGKYEMIGEFETLKIEGGKGIFSQVARSVGEKKWGGLISVTSPDGGEINYPFDVSYQVAEPNLVISPTKMNVFYYGIDNPVEISVPGIPSNKIRPTVLGGGARISKARKGYVVKPTKTSGKVKIAVMAEIDSKQKSMGSMEFRIKTIPEPKAKIMGKSSGTIAKALLINAPGVIAELEDFVFDLKFKVTKFTITITKGGYTSELNQKGSSFSSQQKDAIKGLKSGSKIIIENIEAKGPDGRTKPLSPIIFRVR